MHNSSLFSEQSFYPQFCRDLSRARQEVVIESPFISTARMRSLLPFFAGLAKRKIKIFIVTRDPKEHVFLFARQAATEIAKLQALGVTVFFCEKGHHRKLAIIDRKILWEGSLNILSQVDSIEIMRRTEEKVTALEMMQFSGIIKYLE